MMEIERDLKTGKVIEPQRGIGFILHRGESLKVTDTEGQQVSDLFCFSKENLQDALSSGRSIDYNDTFLFTERNILYSQSGLPMLEIIEDSCGRHDFLVTPCSLQMFQMLSGTTNYHPSCQENLEKAFERYNINCAQITSTFNIFMNVGFHEDGRIKVLKPKSKAGDYIIFEARMDLIVGLTACSDEGTNNGCCKPIEFEIFRKN